MSLSRPTVFLTEREDGSADITVCIDDEDHRFSISPDGSVGYIEFEETLTWRGQIRTSAPDEDVWKGVMQSEEVTNYLEDHDLKQIRRRI
jgi:hypothetical protein